MRALLLATASLSLGVCTRSSPSDAPPSPPPPPSAVASSATSATSRPSASTELPVGAPIDPDTYASLVAKVKEIAATYTSYGRVDDELRWAPWLCRMPMPATAHPSTSQDAATHGRKLYSVFVRDHEHYPDAQIGQVVVKESWVPELTTFAKQAIPYAEQPHGIEADHFVPYAVGEDGKVYRAGRKAGLFVMFKTAGGAQTDDGWVYATTTPEGVVTSAGREFECMHCHEKAPHGRLFGVARANF
jgi:hypothetical protein